MKKYNVGDRVCEKKAPSKVETIAIVDGSIMLHCGAAFRLVYERDIFMFIPAPRTVEWLNLKIWEDQQEDCWLTNWRNDMNFPSNEIVSRCMTAYNCNYPDALYLLSVRTYTINDIVEPDGNREVTIVDNFGMCAWGCRRIDRAENLMNEALTYAKNNNLLLNRN